MKKLQGKITKCRNFLKYLDVWVPSKSRSNWYRQSEKSYPKTSTQKKRISSWTGYNHLYLIKGHVWERNPGSGSTEQLNFRKKIGEEAIKWDLRTSFLWSVKSARLELGSFVEHFVSVSSISKFPSFRSCVFFSLYIWYSQKREGESYTVLTFLILLEWRDFSRLQREGFSSPDIFLGFHTVSRTSSGEYYLFLLPT